MKKYILASLALASIMTVSAQEEVLKITMNDGTQATFAVSEIKEMSFATETPDEAQLFAGVYAGTQTMTVGGQWQYSAEISYTLTAEEDGTLTVAIPEYSLTGTMMGDLTLGAVTIKGLEYDEEKGGFYRFYANTGMTQHFKAVNNGQTTMDKDYDLGGESSILVKLDGNSITVENPFKLGAMPFPLTGDFKGTKE